jgi:predicted DNA-binding transcriptional regulator AlpA
MTPDASPQPPHGADRLALRLDEVARSLGVSRRAIERERSAGRFPTPDLHIGRMPLWTPAKVKAWVEGGGR